MKVTLRRKAVPLVTHYDVLGCSPSDDDYHLHTAYLELAFNLHPDRGGDEEKFKAVNLAWSALKNKEHRKQYDTQLFIGRLLNCLTCKGTGKKSRWVDGKYTRNLKCPDCEGKGHV